MNLKFSPLMVLGQAKEDLNNNADGFSGDTHYKNIIPLKSRSKRIRLLKNTEQHLLGSSYSTKQKFPNCQQFQLRMYLATIIHMTRPPLPN